MRNLIFRSIAVWAIVSSLLILAGGLLYDIHACGGINECGDDLGGGLFMVVLSGISIGISFLVALSYIVLSLRTDK